MTAEPYDFSPACWEWEPPGDALRKHVREKYAYLMKGSLGEAMVPRLVMTEWQDGRCGVCGNRVGQDAMVEDHDHGTAMVRGYLCRSCNTREGRDTYGGRVWQEYRERNPASICGLRERYWNSWTGQFAEPAPPLTDPWEKNPMQGVL